MFLKDIDNGTHFSVHNAFTPYDIDFIFIKAVPLSTTLQLVFKLLPSNNVYIYFVKFHILNTENLVF